MRHVHTGENLTITYKRNGEYDDEALKKINWILRDWRRNEATRMDPREIDLLWEIYQEVEAKEPINIICGYRSPETNAMLRRRSKGVAKFSQHTLGKAIDFFIPGVPLEKVRAAAMKLQGGGVGYYPTSGSPFVHVDIGSVRAWPRMTREQLVKLFPDGRTVHIPSDGSPLPGYQLARADLERKGNQADPPRKRSLLATLFGTARDSEESDDNAAVHLSPAARPGLSAKQAAASKAVVAAAGESTPSASPVPLPPVRPIYQIASNDRGSAVTPFVRPLDRQSEPAALTPSQIVDMRGYWVQLAQSTLPSDGPDDKLTRARKLLASSLGTAAGQEVTSSIGPFAAPDRVPPDIALAYAAQADATGQRPIMAAAAGPANVGRTLVISRSESSSIAVKSIETKPHGSFTRTVERQHDPWLRGLMLTESVQDVTVTRFGEPDFVSLAEHMHKPQSTVVMTFSHDPYLGVTTDAFTGSAVVFQATMTFADQRTALLQLQ